MYTTTPYYTISPSLPSTSRLYICRMSASISISTGNSSLVLNVFCWILFEERGEIHDSC